MFLTLQECIDWSGLDEEEILAIAEHEHVPEIIAVELGNYLSQSPEGEHRIKKMILDDIKAARERGDRKHAATLKTVLKHYLEKHAAA